MRQWKKENPAPKNIDPVKFSDHSIVKAKKSSKWTLTEKDLKTVQKKIRDVLDPIYSLCAIIEKKAINKKLEEKKEPVSLEDINRLIDKSVILLGQGNDKFAYFGRLNILSMSLISKSDAEYLLKEF